MHCSSPPRETGCIHHPRPWFFSLNRSQNQPILALPTEQFRFANSVLLIVGTPFAFFLGSALLNGCPSGSLSDGLGWKGLLPPPPGHWDRW